MTQSHSGGSQPVPPAPYRPDDAPPAAPRSRPRTTSGLAIASFVLGLFGIVPVGIGLGIAALVRIPRKGQRGKGWAIGGIVLSLLWTAAVVTLIVAAVASLTPERDASGRVTEPGEAAVDDLRAGDCIEKLPEGSQVTTLKAVPCGQRSGGKVYAVFDLPDGDWPGQAQVQGRAESECTKRFQALPEQPAEKSEIFFLHPTDLNWKLGHRQVTCVLVPSA